MLQAYGQTEFHVHSEPQFILRIGQPNAALLSAHKHHRVDSSAFITAWNPYSQAVDAAENAARQQTLEQELVRRSLYFYPGLGQHPSGQWPG